jgi:rhodanese-related sulfurtransferase
MSVSTITPRQLNEICAGGKHVELVDVRTPVEFAEIHATFARNIPLDRLDPKIVQQSRDGCAEDPVYVICRSGNRGQKACEKFLSAGFTNIVNVEGGTLAWAECGLPVVRGKKMISLQRQVQMTAGSIVLAGALLAVFVHPAFAWISAAIGAGLLFTGLTDTCAMGMFLARMPWNRVGTSTDACCSQ